MNSKKETMLIHDKMIRKNKVVKVIRKNSLKMYGRAPKGVIKNKIGKVVFCASGDEVEKDFKEVKPGCDEETLIEMCKNANLTGMSGSGFPVYRKLEAFVKAEVMTKCIVINAAECEPGLIHDQWLIEHKFQQIVYNAMALCHILKAESIHIAAKSFPDGSGRTENSVALSKVPPLYPMGEEKILIKQVLGITLDREEIPVEKGILVLNLQTLLQIFETLSGNEPVGRYVTLCSLDTGKAYAVYVKYGENIKNRLVQLFGENTYYKAGFGAMNARDVSEEDAFTPTVCFAAVASYVAAGSIENRCKGCGKCKKVCPMGIDVKKAVSMMEKNSSEGILKLGIEKCIGCGSCSFVCAANKCPHEIVGAYHAKIKG